MAKKKSIDAVFQGARRVKSNDGLRQQAHEHLERNQQLREMYAQIWAWVAVIQLGVTLALIVAQGSTKCPWKLDASVMMAFLGAASLNTLSVVLAISRGLFNSPKN